MTARLVRQETPVAMDPLSAGYQQRTEQLAKQRDELRGLDITLTWARGGAFVIALGCAFAAWGNAISWWWLCLPVVGFLALAVWHEQVAERFTSLDLLETIYRHQLARHQRRLAELPLISVEVPAEHQSLAADLDLFGPRSVFQWLCVAATPMGREVLRDWLLNPANQSTIETRQKIVRALASETDWREALQLSGARLGKEPESAKKFLSWAAGPRFLETRRWLMAIALITPLCLVAGIVGWAAGALSATASIVVIAGAVLVNAIVTISYTPAIHEIFYAVAGRANQVSHYRDILKLAMILPERVGQVTIGEQDLRVVSQVGLDKIARLETIVRIANARGDVALFLVYIVTQLALLRDVHLLAWLERWQRRWGQEAGHWFAAIGQLEALTSLATVAHEHPDWVYPRIMPQATKLTAAGLGHPLLSNERRVINDVELGPAGTFLLVTGSNMSGKSTLLRSIGVNVLLAQMGSVVCARDLALPSLTLGTSIRVNDSLAEGVSFFLAELLRLKEIIQRASQAKSSGRQLLYLLDEILQGTNSRERQIAVIHVLGHLLKEHAIGAISTHDLDLASAPELSDTCRIVHFRETLQRESGQTVMSFDYQLRPGLAPTTNALVLLEIVGL